jgi:DNA-binding PadR family transcriptional regulator
MKSYHDGSGQRVSIGNVYRELQRLASEGLVRSAPNPPDADARRILYEITRTGADQFDAWLARSSRDGAEGEHLLKAFFAVNGEPSIAARVLEHWEEELAARRRKLERVRRDALERGHDAGLRSLPLFLDHRLRHVAVDLDFVSQVRSACDGEIGVDGSGNERSTRPTRRSQQVARARTRRA